MSSKKYVTVKEVTINNNCPECFGQDGLKLFFKQEFIETSLHKKITQNIKHDIVCSKCNTPIYPVMWTDDIERVFEYHKRAFIPKKSNTKLKGVAWGIIGGIIALVIGAAAFAYYKFAM